MPAYKDRVNKGFKEDRQGSRLRLRGRGARLTAITALSHSLIPETHGPGHDSC